MPFEAIPNQFYPFEGGTASESSYMRVQRMQAEQAAMSRKFSGGRSRRYRGGSSTISPALITIPSFPSGGTKVSPFDANSASLNSNRTLIGGLSQAQNDCYATGTCLAKGGGRRHKSRRHKSRRHKSRRHKSRRNKSRKTRTRMTKK